MSKKTDKRPVSAPNEQTLAQQTVASLQRGLVSLDGHVRETCELIDTRGSDNKRASELAKLLTQMAAVLDAVRKAEAQEAKAAGSLSKAIVMSWFRQLDPAERSGLVREIARIGEEGSVLA